MTKTKDLVLIEGTTALEIFSTEGGLDPLIQEVRDFVDGFEHDLSTGVGRKRTASLAAKVASLKVRMDDMGKDLVSGWKDKAKKVDASRKAMRDELDQLKVLARKPLTDWEEEEDRIREETKARIAAKRLADEIQADHEMALLMNEKVDRDAADAAAEAERERQAEEQRLAQEQADREARLQREAADNARIEAEQAAQAERDRIENERLEAIRREEEAKAQAKQADLNRQAAEQRARDQELQRLRDAEQAKENARIQAEQNEINRKNAEAQAETNRRASEERARQEEIQRQQDEQDRIKREQQQRDSDIQNVSDVRRRAKEGFMALGISEGMAKAAVIAIHKGNIANVSIQY